MFQILVVEDDVNQSRLMKAVLEHAGYSIHSAGDGLIALDIMDKQHIDLIVLDVMMPRMNGYELTELLRSSGDMTPILMITAKQLPADKIKGFASGTDDYMTKPVDEDELIWRIKALLRRAKIVSEKKLTIKNITLDYDAMTVSRNGQVQTLPQKEFQLLYKLLANQEHIFTRMQLMDEIWGLDSETSDSTVTVHINRLRKRFEGCKEFEIVAIRGVGYKAVIHDES